VAGPVAAELPVHRLGLVESPETVQHTRPERRGVEPLPHIGTVRKHGIKDRQRVGEFLATDQDCGLTYRQEIFQSGLPRQAAQNLLRLVYQPIFGQDGQLSAFEALLRFQHPRLGNISPTRFIPIAEETHLIVPIGTWVLRQACRQLKAWKDAGHPPVRVGVNISALQFARRDFAAMVAGMLRDFAVSPECLLLELTESVVMEDYSAVLRQMNLLQEFGIHIAMDDFGTGYSSLSYLHKLPINMLKIDRSFIERLGDADGTRPIVEAVIAMGEHLGLEIVAEGVETLEQQLILQEAGCHRYQGFLFSPIAARRSR